MNSLVAVFGAGGVFRRASAFISAMSWRQIEDGAVFEEAAPLRIETAEVERVVHVAAGFGEDALARTRAAR